MKTRITIVIVWIVCSVTLYLLFGFVYGFNPAQWSYKELHGSFKNNVTSGIFVFWEIIFMMIAAISFVSCGGKKS